LAYSSCWKRSFTGIATFLFRYSWTCLIGWKRSFTGIATYVQVVLCIPYTGWKRSFTGIATLISSGTSTKRQVENVPLQVLQRNGHS